MHNTAYRQYNVDVFDPAQFLDHQEGEATLSSGPDEAAVRDCLASNELEDALKSVLLSPPIGNTEQTIKDKSTLLVSQVLHSFKSSEFVEKAVQNLSIGEGDILMKYIYKAMQLCSDAHLLTWHAHLVGKFGYGAIVRVFTDRQRL